MFSWRFTSATSTVFIELLFNEALVIYSSACSTKIIWEKWAAWLQRARCRTCMRMSRSTPSVYRAPTRLAPRHERHPWIILSKLWKSRTAQALHLPLSMRPRQPRARLHPVQLPRLAPRPRGCIRLSKLVSSCPWPSAARYPANRTRRGRSDTSTS